MSCVQPWPVLCIAAANHRLFITLWFCSSIRNSHRKHPVPVPNTLSQPWHRTITRRRIAPSLRSSRTSGVALSLITFHTKYNTPQTHNRAARDERCANRVPSSSGNTTVLVDQGATRRIEIVLTDQRTSIPSASINSNGAVATSQHKQQQQQQQHELTPLAIYATPAYPYYPQARKSISLSHASTTQLATTSTVMSQERDRLGLLGVGDHDAEVSGSLSGLQRLSTARYNKVSASDDNVFSACV